MASPYSDARDSTAGYIERLEEEVKGVRAELDRARKSKPMGSVQQAASYTQQSSGYLDTQMTIEQSRMQKALNAMNGILQNNPTPKISNEKQWERMASKPKEKHMFGFAREYLEKHKDTVMTVLVALIIDHFFLGGALREKIKGITEGILDSAQKKLSHTPALENKDADTKTAA